jgi:hypothetical protein
MVVNAHFVDLGVFYALDVVVEGNGSVGVYTGTTLFETVVFPGKIVFLPASTEEITLRPTPGAGNEFAEFVIDGLISRWSPTTVPIGDNMNVTVKFVSVADFAANYNRLVLTITGNGEVVVDEVAGGTNTYLFDLSNSGRTLNLLKAVTGIELTSYSGKGYELSRYLVNGSQETDDPLGVNLSLMVTAFHTSLKAGYRILLEGTVPGGMLSPHNMLFAEPSDRPLFPVIRFRWPL